MSRFSGRKSFNIPQNENPSILLVELCQSLRDFSLNLDLLNNLVSSLAPGAMNSG
jgi:hypothetical protein